MSAVDIKMRIYKAQLGCIKQQRTEVCGLKSEKERRKVCYVGCVTGEQAIQIRLASLVVLF